MPTQWEIDLTLKIRFTCIRLNLSYTIHPRTHIKGKTGCKILSQNYVKISFYEFSTNFKLPFY